MAEFPVIAIRSVDLGVPDVARAEAFYKDVWGLAVVARQRDAVFLRATGRDHHVLALHRSSLRGDPFGELSRLGGENAGAD